MTPGRLLRRSKYDLIGMMTSDATGTILDIGARDCILKKHLRSDHLNYVSADIIPGHDYTFSLDEPLPFDDAYFDIVCALDVLEHLERPQDALAELVRVASNRVYVALPNTSCAQSRWMYFTKGCLGGKYHLTADHPGDRHRWLVDYRQAVRMMEELASRLNCTLTQLDLHCLGSSRLQAAASILPLPLSLRTWTLLFELRKSSISE